MSLILRRDGDAEDNVDQKITLSHLFGSHCQNYLEFEYGTQRYWNSEYKFQKLAFVVYVL